MYNSRLGGHQPARQQSLLVVSCTTNLHTFILLTLFFVQINSYQYQYQYQYLIKCNLQKYSPSNKYGVNQTATKHLGGISPSMR